MSDMPVLSKFTLRIEQAPRPAHWPTALFFALLVAAAYGMVGLFVGRESLAGLRAVAEAAALLRMPCRWLGGMILLGAIFAIATRGPRPGQPSEWWSEKLFDDKAALGSAALLTRNGFDVSETFFRSRIRPGLTGWLLPWTALLPHRLSSSTYTPSDRKERLFTFYDRAGWSYGRRLYPEASVFLFAFTILTVFAVGGVGRRMGAGPIASAGLTALTGFGVAPCLYNALSVAPNLATTLAALALAAIAWQRPGWAGIAAAGVAMSFCLLVKETAIIPATAVVLWQLGGWRRAGSSPRFPRAAQFALYWAVAASGPLIYYGLVLDTGFRELADNHSLVGFHQEYHGYEPLTLASGLRMYWEAFGPMLVLAPLGLAALARKERWSDADRFFLAWFIGSLWTAGMPYLFVRFLLFSAPPFAYFALRGLELLLDKAPGLRARLLSTARGRA